MKFADYICESCGKLIEDIRYNDEDLIRAVIVCPFCGGDARKKFSFNKVIPKHHRAV